MMDAIDGLESLVKGKGEGSRGGKVIGHTASGKPIYAAGPGKGVTKHPDKGSEDPKARHKGAEHYGRDDSPGLTPHGSKGLLAHGDRSDGASFHGSPGDHMKAHQQAFGTGREGAHPGDGVKVLSAKGLHHAAKWAARGGHENHLDQIKAEVEKRESKKKPEGRDARHHDEAHFIAQAYGTGGVHASKMHRVSTEKSMDAIDALTPLVKADAAGPHEYKTKKMGPHGWEYVYEKKGPKNPKQQKEHSKYEAAKEGHDKHLVRDMTLTAENEYSLHGQRQSINKNLINKMAAGKYDHHEARKLWQYHADAAAKHYHKTQGTKPSIHDRRQMAHELADQFHEEAMDGEHDYHLHKKHAKNLSAKMSGKIAIPAYMEDSMKSERYYAVEDYARLAKSALYGFSDPMGRDAAIPEAYLQDYLCAFVEEALEHERKEKEHRNKIVPKDGDLASYYAKCVMGELVRKMPQNKNLSRAAKKFKVNRDYLAALIRDEGMLPPEGEGYGYTDDYDSWMSMGFAGRQGTNTLKLSEEPSAWAQGAPGIRTAPAPATVEVYDDRSDPHAMLRKSREHIARNAWGIPDADAPSPNVDSACLIHGRDLYKSMNLDNPYAKCSCPK